MKTTIRVDEMSCDHCKKRIEKALQPIASEVTVDLENKNVQIVHQNTVSEKEILEAIDEAGFDGKVL